MEHNHHQIVLIVDDEPVIRLVAAQALADAGFETIEAATADDALAILRQRGDVGVLFTDINMPGSIDGMDLARLVHEQWPAIRIVVTSGRALPGPVPDDGRFVGKPYSMGRMTQIISEVSGTLPQG